MGSPQLHPLSPQALYHYKIGRTGLLVPGDSHPVSAESAIIPSHFGSPEHLLYREKLYQQHQQLGDIEYGEAPLSLGHGWVVDHHLKGSKYPELNVAHARRGGRVLTEVNWLERETCHDERVTLRHPSNSSWVSLKQTLAKTKDHFFRDNVLIFGCPSPDIALLTSGITLANLNLEHLNYLPQAIQQALVISALLHTTSPHLYSRGFVVEQKGKQSESVDINIDRQGISIPYWRDFNNGPFQLMNRQTSRSLSSDSVLIDYEKGVFYLIYRYDPRHPMDPFLADRLEFFLEDRH